MRDEQQWSPEPWHYDPATRHINVEGDARIVVDVVNVFWDEAETNANGERIVACVNACEGISTQNLVAQAQRCEG